MTEKPEQAIARARELPDAQQDAIAALVLEEIADEARWDTAFARSHGVLERLAAEAEEENRAELTRELNPDAL